MPHHFRPYQPEQPLLLPPDLRDWLSEDHLVYTVSELVDALDLSAFYAPYAQQGSGNLPYAPAMMVKILVYGYATGVLVVSAAGAETGGGRGLPGAGGGESAAASHDL